MSDEVWVRNYRLHARIVLDGEDEGEVVEWCEPLPGYVRWQDTGLYKAYELLLKWGREKEEQSQNTEYDGMSNEERIATVYGKYERGELSLTEMSHLEWESWLVEQNRRDKRFDNWLWNHENHRFLLKRIYGLREHLSDAEWQTIENLLEECEWGEAEVVRVKEIVETAEWFNRLGTQDSSGE